MEKYACTECSYLYRPAFGEEGEGIEPGTAFSSIPETFACPSCGASKEVFFAIREEVNEPFDPEDPSEAELCHIPFYRITEDGVEVQIGSEDLPHPDEGDHFTEWVALFDEDGETLEAKIRPKSGETIVFEGFEADDFFEVRAACTLHGIWKGLPQS